MAGEPSTVPFDPRCTRRPLAFSAVDGRRAGLWVPSAAELWGSAKRWLLWRWLLWLP